MARIRTIKPDFFINDQLAELDPLVRIFYIGLWTQADREGRMEERQRRLKAAILPYDECDVESMLSALVGSGHIDRYEVDGQSYIQVLNFSRHQSPNMKEKPSTIPARDACSASTVPAQCQHHASTSLKEGKGKEGKGEGEDAHARDESFARAWESYPLHRYRDKARHAFDTAVVLNHADPELIIAACGRAPRDTRQSLSYFIDDGTWLDYVPRAKPEPCTNQDCQSGYVVTEDGAVRCPECNCGAR